MYTHTHIRCTKCKNGAIKEKSILNFIGGSGNFWGKVKVEFIQYCFHIGYLLVYININIIQMFTHVVPSTCIFGNMVQTFLLTPLGLIGRHKTHFNFLFESLPDYTRISILRVFTFYLNAMTLFLLIKSCWSLRIYNSEPN